VMSDDKMATNLQMVTLLFYQRGCDPLSVGISQLLRRTSSIRPSETVQKNYTNEETSPDLDEDNNAKSLKVSKAKRFKESWQETNSCLWLRPSV
jgi:hypothetical protein